MMDGHTDRTYDEELARLDETIVQMGKLAKDQLVSAMNALTGKNVELAGKIVAGDSGVNELERNVDNLVVRLLALRQPVARDLRLIVSALKISVDLERVADYAANIAKRIPETDPAQLDEPVGNILRMARLVQDMIESVVSAYLGRNAADALSAWRGDKEVNEIYVGLLGELRTSMMENPRRVPDFTHLIFIAKSIERMGDHVKNVAEHIYYMVHGVGFPDAGFSAP